MERITFNKTFQKVEAVNEWGEIIGQYLDRLNPGREGKYKPLTPSGVGKLLKQAGYGNTTAIRDLYKELSQADNFSKLFWFKVKK